MHTCHIQFTVTTSIPKIWEFFNDCRFMGFRWIYTLHDINFTVYRISSYRLYSTLRNPGNHSRGIPFHTPLRLLMCIWHKFSNSPGNTDFFVWKKLWKFWRVRTQCVQITTQILLDLKVLSLNSIWLHLTRDPTTITISSLCPTRYNGFTLQILVT